MYIYIYIYIIASAAAAGPGGRSSPRRPRRGIITSMV